MIQDQYIDTHCHINVMIKDNFDILLTEQHKTACAAVVHAAQDVGVTTIINVGTSLSESKNCVQLAQWFDPVYAVVGIHPNDATANWKKELAELAALLPRKQELKIVGIGECGLDFHYPDYNTQRQVDAFKAQIELSLEHDLALVVHTRDAPDETLRVIEPYASDITRCIIHCFNQDSSFAHTATQWGCALGVGGTVTYPRNHTLRETVTNVKLSDIVLETDAPFLPIQSMRGKQNSPIYIPEIAAYIAKLRNISVQEVAHATTQRARAIFSLPS